MRIWVSDELKLCMKLLKNASRVPMTLLRLASYHARAVASSSVQANDRVPPLHLHAVAHVQFVNKERMFDPRRSLLRELVHGGLEFVA